VAYVERALSPAKVMRVTMVSDEDKVMEVVVEDKQLSLAIGKKGQNVRLAAKLTGWKIDIKSEEEKRKEVEAQLEGLEFGEGAEETRPLSLPDIHDEVVAVLKAAGFDTVEMQSAVAQLRQSALASGQFFEPITMDVNEAGTVANIAISIDGEGTDAASESALATLRDHVIPTTIGAVPGTEVAVTGITAESKDFNDRMRTVAPLVFGFVLLLAFLIMLVAFRSVVIAAKTIVLNLLSVAAAYGVLVLVFQHGWGKGVIGFESTAGIDSFLPIFLFVILFGLSMDYHVFILSRIREAYDRGISTDDAIAHGIKTTAGVVTSAAVVMVCVFSVFATLQMLIFKQFGVGAAVAVLLDATVIRAVLLPATMKLLGDWNWYMPAWLEWLPHMEQERSAVRPKPAPAPAPAGR